MHRRFRPRALCALLASALSLLALLGAHSATAATTRYEAEGAVISSGAVATNHLNYSGAGFVDTTNASGVYVEFTMTAANAGTATVGLRYANGTTADRPADVAVNGTTVSAGRSFGPTADWDTWVTSTLAVPVVAGSNKIRLTATTANGLANLDYADVDVAVPAADYQAEDATLSQAAVVTNHLNYTGSGFVDYTNTAGSSVQFTVEASAAGQAGLIFRYANGTTVDRPMDIAVNGAVVASGVSFPATADWDTWVTKTVNANLVAGTNTIRATATTANGGPNLDKLTLGAPATGGTGTPMAAAPYEYLGWGNPQKPTDVMNATGVKWFTLAFILSDGTCNPAWDGSRPLTGGSDQSAINSIRAAGGDVVISVGGWSGNKLGEKCSSASALAGAYQKVISAYHLKALDIDIEDTEFSNSTVRQRVVDALKIVKTNNPGIVTYVTMGTTPTGPDATGKDLINKGAAAGLANDAWVIMPFDFGGHSGSMGQASVSALDGLKAAVKSAYGYSDDTAYRHIGVSSMNGTTDETDETVTTTDFRTILTYAQTHHIARYAFWSVNRDRACGSGSDGDSCSGVSQSAYDFTKIVVQYKG